MSGTRTMLLCLPIFVPQAMVRMRPQICEFGESLENDHKRGHSAAEEHQPDEHVSPRLQLLQVTYERSIDFALKGRSDACHSKARLSPPRTRSLR